MAKGDGKTQREGVGSGRTPGESGKARFERQAAALRENLRRRKAQHRAREAGEETPGADDDQR